MAVSAGVDWVGLSFVREATAVDRVRGELKKLGRDLPVLAKMERPEAVERAEAIVEAFDGIDNGISTQQGPALYKSRTDISSRIGYLNPRWNEEYNDQILDQRFEQASSLAGKEFLERVDYTAKAWLPARDIVLKAIQERKQVHDSGRVLVFETFSPWKVSHSTESGGVPCQALFQEVSNARVPAQGSVIQNGIIVRPFRVR